MEIIKIDKLIYKGKNCLSLQFPYNNTLQNIVRKLDHPLWSASLKMWIVNDNQENRKNLKLLFKDLVTFQPGENLKLKAATDNSLPLTAASLYAIEKYTQWLRSRRYSDNTVKT